MDLTQLNRLEAYWDGLKSRIGWDPREDPESSFLVHTAGVSFNDRQNLLDLVDTWCKFDRSPIIKLEKEPDNPYDKFAVKVLVVTQYDDVTGQPVFSHVGYIPKGRCFYCARTLSGRKAGAQICPGCNADISITSPNAHMKTFNKWVVENFDNIVPGVDTVTKASSGLSKGLDIWLRKLS